MFGLLVGSLANSQFVFGAELDSGPGSVTGSRLVTNSKSVTGIDFAIAKRFQFSILRLTMGNFPRYDQSLHNTYMSTASVGSLSNNARILHNYNIG